MHSKSKWLVGSSNNSISDSLIRDLINPTLLFWPPDKFLMISFLFNCKLLQKISILNESSSISKIFSNSFSIE